MMRSICVFFLSLLFTQVSAQDISYTDMVCKDNNAQFVPIKINAEHVIRHEVPTTLFGFHHPWYDFQTSFLKGRNIYPEVLDWLKFFPGAVYRFPGGNSYDWQRAIENNIYKRKKMRARYSREGFIRPLYGLSEFVKFLNMVNGKAIIMLNLVGPDGKLSPTNTMVQHNQGMVNWFRNSSAWHCSSGKSCPILYWELGNELDWPDTNWSAEEYINRASPLISRLLAIDPNISLAVLGKTAPWNTEELSEQFNRKLASIFAGKVKGVTLHPYYDGLPIPVMMSWISKTVASYIKINSKVKVVVTEHARWPTKESVKWEDDWYKASGSMGAISSADFIISMMEMPEVEVAAWHALSAIGPWQLFHIDKNSKKIYPSAVYWGLRVLRDAYLTDVVSASPSKTLGSDYPAGYSLHIIAMKDKHGHISILGVNRGKRPIQLSFDVNGVVDSSGHPAVFKYLKADSLGRDNSDRDKNRFTMQQRNISFNGKFLPGICVPSLSVFSVYK